LPSITVWMSVAGKGWSESTSAEERPPPIGAMPGLAVATLSVSVLLILVVRGQQRFVPGHGQLLQSPRRFE
jgi:hypothetical protein